MAITEQDVLNALMDCYDPELPVNIVDLGLVYAVRITPDENSTEAFPRQRVEVDVTMTTQACPSHGIILERVQNRLAGVAEISDAAVNLVWEPAWTPNRISQQARERLGLV
ncbi:MAG TPA: metal-sulfur cluster assembly factor [Acidobacteriaceae bacterium]|nr:metal-sulfur cluster assembly factor [Acidobacteriaceae bacterium]